MPTGNIRKNYIYNLSFQIFSLLIPFVTAPYVSRVLLPDGVGTYSYVNSIATYFSLFAALGLSSYGTREVSRVRDNPKKASKLFWELSVLRLISTAICLALYLGFILLTGSDMRIYLAAGIVILTVGVDCNWFFQAMENFKALMVRNFIVKLLSVTCIFLFVKGPDDLVLYFLIQGGGMFLSNLVLRAQLAKSIMWIPPRKWYFGRHIRETLVYFVPTIATSVYTVLDRTMIGVITKDMTANGYYEQAHKIINIAMTVITSLNVVVGVRTSYLFAQNKRKMIREHIYRTFRFMFMLAFPLAAGIVACAADFVPWFYGDGYEPVVPLMMLFAPLLFIIGISNVLGTLYLTPSGQRARSNRAIIAGAVCNFILNLLLIPRLGVYGAVIASLAAELLISALYLSYSAHFISVYQVLGTGLRYLLLSVGMFVPVFFIGRALESSFSVTLLQIAVGIVTYALLLIVSRDPTWLDIKKFIIGKLKKSED
ncbi:MAG: flippase [Clostridia bacterium]|nr:flippase [Clostridia bacterium]